MGKQRKLIAFTSDGKTTYRAEEYPDKIVVRRTTGGPLSFGEDRIGSARSLSDAIDIVKSHAGASRVEFE